LAFVVADDGADGDLGGDIAGHPAADGLHPLLEQDLGLELVAGGDPHVGRHLQDLLEALPLVEALGEAQPGAGDARQRLAPPDQILGRDAVLHGRAGYRRSVPVMAPSTDRSGLARAVYDTAHITGTFRLRSGVTSNEYFDKYLFEADPGLLRGLATAMAPLVPAGTEALAGLE